MSTKKLHGKIAVPTDNIIGASGLGHELSSILSQLGVIVIIIDVPFVTITNAILLYGTPTILINSVAILDAEPIETMSFEKFRRVIDVNFISHFNMVKIIITFIYWTAYCASKAALVSFHESLKYELFYSNFNIQTTLVVPGQLNTPLFQDVETPSRLLAPILDPIYVSEKIIKAIINNLSTEIYTPLYCSVLPVLRCMPIKFQKIFRHLSGIDKASRKYVLIKEIDYFDYEYILSLTILFIYILRNKNIFR
ncbi:unnamed protein product [Pneumocystis jirovecii]|uniref:Uncharacterized protein n=1 Tax=Pneumocystis jirovecii TaxID=42068 RepID=L0PC15_PNEJI|nr:unnamed protein product [Pneumocystis jirovecii]